MNKADYKILNIPQKYVVLYLIFSLILYQFGPFDWITYYPFEFWTLNIAYVISFALGWQLFASIRVRVDRWNDEILKINLNKKIIFFLLIVNLINELAILQRAFSIEYFDVLKLYSSISSGLSNPGESYRKLQENQWITGKFVVYFSFFFYFISFNLLLTGIFYFKYLNYLNKILISITIFIIFLRYLSTGTNIGIFRIVFAFIFTIVINSHKERFNYQDNKYKHLSKILIFCFIIFFISVFNILMQSRNASVTWQSSSYYYANIIQIDRDSFFFKLIPENFHYILIMSSLYLTQGYYGMSLCLSLPWEPGFGFAHSMALLKLNSLNSLTYISYLNSYQHRLTPFGWTEDINWHTMYSWFANDITFYGVIPLMFLLGISFCISYRESIINNNPYAKLVSYYFSLAIFFIPCNNLLFQSFYTLFSFYFSLLLWIFSRYKINISFK